MSRAPAREREGPSAGDEPAAEATIAWYPGHMAAAMRRLGADLRAIDVVIEIADARLPHAGTNPALERLAGNRPRLLVLSRSQLAEPNATAGWLAHYRRQGRDAIAIDARTPGGVSALRDGLKRLVAARPQKSARAIVLGIPNAGKSTVINALAGRIVARAEDRAGVTRARQWFRTGPVEIMDTPGILPPKVNDPEAQWKLALIGGVPRARFDPEDVIARLCRWYAQTHDDGTLTDLTTFAAERGFVRAGNLPDTHNAAWAYLAAWGEGKFGRLTLEAPPPC